MTISTKTLHQSLEYTACPMCRLDAPMPHNQLTFLPFCVVQCSGCRLWYLSPRLCEAEMLKVYADTSYFNGGQDYGYAQPHSAYWVQETALKMTFKRFIYQLQQRHMTGGHLLEIGCGYGFLLEMAAPLFKSLTGTDFDQDAIAQVRQLGYQGIQGGIDAIPTTHCYDLIIATGVIEHIYEPISFIRQLRQHLQPHGWMVFATPQMNSFWFKLQGKRWPSFKIPEHVVYYDKPTLSALFRRCDATQTLVLPYPHAYPLGTIGDKLGITLPTVLAKYPIWLPATMFAIAARFDK